MVCILHTTSKNKHQPRNMHTTIRTVHFASFFLCCTLYEYFYGLTHIQTDAITRETFFPFLPMKYCHSRRSVPYDICSLMIPAAVHGANKVTADYI
jgi:hypothetical protein